MFGVVYRCGVIIEVLEQKLLSYINTQWPSSKICTTVHTRTKNGKPLKLCGNPNNSMFKRLAQEHFVKCGLQDYSEYQTREFQDYNYLKVQIGFHKDDLLEDNWN